MAKGYESSITVWENDGWWSEGTSDPVTPIVNSEGLKRTLITSERSSMARNTRSTLEESLVWEESKPEGELSLTPKIQDMIPILYSHFQMRSTFDSGSSYQETFVPSKFPPNYSEAEYGVGTYGGTSGAVYSVNVWKKFAEGDSSYGNGSQNNTEKFGHGICDKLTLKQVASEDFEAKMDFKFKDYAGTYVAGDPGDTGLGSLSAGSITDWSHGTWSIQNSSLSSPELIPDTLTDISIECSNNLTEKKTLGAQSRQVFDFGNYTVKGNFTTEWLSDYFQASNVDYIGGEPLSITGTIWHSDTEWMTIDMPRVRIKPNENFVKKPNELITVNVPFEAYEYNGTSPITVTTNTLTSIVEPKFILWDASFGARTLSEYDFADAGSTSRVLGDYDFADRDL